jgi:hypothetical protein
MRLPGTQLKLCHSLPVGHEMTHGEIHVKELCCHSPTVGHGMRNDETAWHRENVVLLTFCL